MSSASTSMPIVIAMATYNGMRFLDAQLRSLQAQTQRAWTLIVRDDGSTDGTRERLVAAARDDSRIQLADDGLGNLGPVGNFGRLAALALAQGAERCLFADQDDEWDPDKVERLVATIAATEARHGADCPVLAHSDLRLVDDEGHTIAPSFMAFQHIHHVSDDPLRTLLVQNFVTGCAMAVNRSLLSLAVPVPAQVPMHDWWFALCAASAGRLAFVAQPTIAYRRHGSNTVAVRGFWRTLNPLRTNWSELWARGVGTHRAALVQAIALRDRLEERRIAAPAASALLSAFVAAHHQPPLARLAALRTLGVRSQTWPRRMALYARVFRYSPT